MADALPHFPGTDRQRHHDRIRAAGKPMWPLIVGFYVLELPWAWIKMFLCGGGLESAATCESGFPMAGIVIVCVLFGALIIVRELWALGRDSEKEARAPFDVKPRESAVSAVVRAPHHVQHGMRRLERSHHVHVHNSIRAVLYVAGGLLAFTAFFREWGDIESGAWLILFGMIAMAETAVWYMRAGSSSQTKDGDDDLQLLS